MGFIHKNTIQSTGSSLPPEQTKNGYVHEEDAVPNVYTLRCIWFIIAIVVLGLLLEFSNIWIVDMDIALPGLIGTLLILLLAEVLGLIVPHTRPWLKYAIVFLDVAAGTVTCIFLTYHTLLVIIIPLLIAAQYSNKRVLLFAYLLSVAGVFISAILGYQYGLCDTNMVLLSVSKASKYGGMLSGAIAPLSERLSSIIIFFALPRALTITAFVPMINAIVKNRQEIIMRDIKLKYMGEHDQDTGFYNRAKYDSMIKEEYVKLENVAVLFFDLNNLKYINDTYGHDAGDEIIKKSAESIQNAADHTMDIYRIGGDEFILVIPGGDKAAAESLLETWKNELKIINSLQSVGECSIAYGFAYGNGKDFSDILKSAEKNMYTQKNTSKAGRSCD